jgi:methionine-rich copper-binding protein CopC
VKETLCVVAVAGVLIVGVAPAAFAHAELDHSSPAAKSTVGAVPKQVVGTYTEAVSNAGRMAIKDGCGKNAVTQTTAANLKFIATIDSQAQPGKWSVRWRMVSADDGHVTSGHFAFTVSGTANCNKDKGAGAPPPASSTGSSFPVIPVVIGAIVLVAAAVVLRRRTAS